MEEESKFATVSLASNQDWTGWNGTPTDLSGVGDGNMTRKSNSMMDFEESRFPELNFSGIPVNSD